MVAGGWLSREKEGWGGVCGSAPAKNHGFEDILYVFSSFSMIIYKILSYTISTYLTSFCSFFGIFPHLDPGRGGDGGKSD